MNIAVPDQVKDFVDQEVGSGHYGSVSEYVCELIRADEDRKSQDRLEALLLEGLQGEGTPLARSDWQEIRREAVKRFELRKTQQTA